MGITNVQLHGEEDSNDPVEERRAAYRSRIEEGLAIHQVTACVFIEIKMFSLKFIQPFYHTSSQELKQKTFSF